MSDLKKRRVILLVLSASLILAGLALGKLFGLDNVRDVLYAAAAVVAGSEIALRAWRSLLNRHASIELLVTIAGMGALAIGEVWEAAAVTFLFTFGAYLEARTLSRTRQVLQSLLDLAPTTAIVLRGGLQVEVLPQEVEPYETVLVKPGMRFPVDGEVLEGRSAVDESAITGEPMPEMKEPGGRVFAGTINGLGLLKVRAEGVGADTTLARIIRRVEEAQEERAPTQRFIERFARWYTPAIILLSLVALGITRDLELSLTLLVIGCPGALVISTPISVVAGIGRAAKSGILIKGGEYLENSGKITALALDKTGTLTEGKPRLTDVLVMVANTDILEPVLVENRLGLSGTDPVPFSTIPLVKPERWTAAQQEVIFWAAVAEAGSEHPLARSILAEVAGEIPAAGEFESLTGLGVSAVYQGQQVAVGTPELMERLGVCIERDALVESDRMKSAGKTAVLVSVDKTLIGILGIADPVRPDAREAIQRLKAAGVKRVLMLTGDDLRTARAIAAEAGIEEVHANLLPEDKLELVRELQTEGHTVAMTGDGINDAPALAAADIGIAMGAAGAGVAIEAADIALMADDLLKLPEAIRLSRATLRNIRQNVAIALLTVTILLAGVILGRVHMAGGMLIHEASVLIVILNGMRLLRQ